MEGALCALQQLASPSQPKRSRFAKKLAPGGQFLYVRPPRHDEFRRSMRANCKNAVLEREPGQKNLLADRAGRNMGTGLVSTPQLPPEYPPKCIPRALPPRKERRAAPRWAPRARVSARVHRLRYNTQLTHLDRRGAAPAARRRRGTCSAGRDAFYRDGTAAAGSSPRRRRARRSRGPSPPFQT